MIYHHEIKNKEEAIKLANCGEHISFDGVYKSVYKYYYLFIEKNCVVTLFPVGDWVGKFDYCDWNELMEMVYNGAILGWHSNKHREPNDTVGMSEIVAPYKTEHFALPYGRYSKEYLNIAKHYYKYIYGTNVEGDKIILRHEL